VLLAPRCRKKKKQVNVSTAFLSDLLIEKTRLSFPHNSVQEPHNSLVIVELYAGALLSFLSTLSRCFLILFAFFRALPGLAKSATELWGSSLTLTLLGACSNSSFVLTDPQRRLGKKALLLPSLSPYNRLLRLRHDDHSLVLAVSSFRLRPPFDVDVAERMPSSTAKRGGEELVVRVDGLGAGAGALSGQLWCGVRIARGGFGGR
jgi:hypothetical protein